MWSYAGIFIWGHVYFFHAGLICSHEVILCSYALMMLAYECIWPHIHALMWISHMRAYERFMRAWNSYARMKIVCPHACRHMPSYELTHAGICPHVNNKFMPSYEPKRRKLWGHMNKVKRAYEQSYEGIWTGCMPTYIAKENCTTGSRWACIYCAGMLST